MLAMSPAQVVANGVQRADMSAPGAESAVLHEGIDGRHDGLERNPIRERDELYGFCADRIATVRRWILKIDRPPPSGAEFVQQRGRQTRCESDDVDIRPLDG